jgi:hypothetical protein
MQAGMHACRQAGRILPHTKNHMHIHPEKRGGVISTQLAARLVVQGS